MCLPVINAMTDSPQKHFKKKRMKYKRRKKVTKTTQTKKTKGMMTTH